MKKIILVASLLGIACAVCYLTAMQKAPEKAGVPDVVIVSGFNSSTPEIKQVLSMTGPVVSAATTLIKVTGIPKPLQVVESGAKGVPIGDLSFTTSKDVTLNAVYLRVTGTARKNLATVWFYNGTKPVGFIYGSTFANGDNSANTTIADTIVTVAHGVVLSMKADFVDLPNATDYGTICVNMKIVPGLGFSAFGTDALSNHLFCTSETSFSDQVKLVSEKK